MASALSPDFAQLLSARDPPSWTARAWEQLGGLEEWAAWTQGELGELVAGLVHFSQVRLLLGRSPAEWLDRQKSAHFVRAKV